jgi:hydroxyethylthiazole kinase-like uncharacterized protein yjeF
MSREIPVTPTLLRQMPLPEPSPDGGKEQRGRVLVVAGSSELPGAALLAGTAALRIGAGKLQIATAKRIAPQLGTAMPEARVVALPETPSGAIAPEAADAIVAHAKACGAVLIGPGMMNHAAVAKLTAAVLPRIPDVPVVLDAAAMMRLLDQPDVIRERAAGTIVTPHAGEMAGMLGIDKAEVEADPAGTAVKVARLLECVVVLKGRCTRIATPKGETWCCDEGNIGLATSGSGDVLAGFLIGLLARGADPVRAALWSVFVHGHAGTRLAQSCGPLGYLARELPGEAPGILRDLMKA